MNELKPCPFCGGKARWTGRYVQCYDCDIRTDEYNTDYNNTSYAKARSAWNRRTQSNEPVKHGKWIVPDDTVIACICSVCGWESNLYEDDVMGMPYCPNCGAKMDSESESNGE